MANASLLDESTAAAEAMSMCFSLKVRGDHCALLWKGVEHRDSSMLSCVERKRSVDDMNHLATHVTKYPPLSPSSLIAPPLFSSLSTSYIRHQLEPEEKIFLR